MRQFYYQRLGGEVHDLPEGQNKLSNLVFKTTLGLRYDHYTDRIHAATPRSRLSTKEFRQFVFVHAGLHAEDDTWEFKLPNDVIVGNRGVVSEKDKEVELLMAKITNVIVVAMEETSTTKAELAKRMGVSRPYITQMLSGKRNVTLRTMAEALYVLGYRLIPLTFPLEAKDD